MEVGRQHWVMPAGGGDLGALRMEQGAVGLPGYGEVTVKVEAVGLNFADIFTVLGLYSPIKSGEIKGAIVPGLEFAGVVERIGGARDARAPDSLNGADQLRRGGQLVKLREEVWALAEAESHKLRVGDRVMGCLRFGAFATRVNAPAHQLRKLPKGWSLAQGAAFTTQTLTAFYALKELGAVRKGQTVLVHSAAGGCGMQALQICARLGVRVVGTVGSPDKVQALLKQFPELRAEQIVVRDATAAGFAAQLDKALAAVGADGFDVVLDAVLGRYFDPAWARLVPGGRHVVFGAASMTPQADSLGVLEWAKLAWQWLWRPRVDPLELPSVNRSVMGFNLIHCLNNASVLRELMDQVETLGLDPPFVGSEFKFHELPEALRLFQSGKTTGKVVLRL